VGAGRPGLPLPATGHLQAHRQAARRARGDRESFIRERWRTCAALEAAGIHAELAGRPKHIYSIWKKMQRKALDFSDLYDIRAVRMLVDNVPTATPRSASCTALWPHLPGEFDDYIARPKATAIARCTRP
jgi:GTP pyrophosphokinase